MAYKQVGQRWSSILAAAKKKFIVDQESDIATLPKCCPGSKALVAEGGIVYIVNASGNWVRTGVAAFSIAEEGAF